MRAKRAIALAAIAAAVCAPKVSGAIDFSSVVEPGVWLESFAAATNLAAETSAPLVFVFGNKGCDHCAALKKALEGDAFRAWMADGGKDFVYLFVEATDHVETGANAGSGAKEFARSAAGTIENRKKWLGGYPYVCLWWPENGGIRKALAFMGRNGQFPAPAKSGAALETQLIAVAESAFAGYEPYRPDAFSFGCGNAPGDRLEAEPGTETVFVPVVRSGAWTKTGAVERVAIDWPDGSRGEAQVSFGAGATNAFLSLSMAGRWVEGGAATLAASGVGAGKSVSVACVPAQANFVTNPYAPGEVSAADLDWTDWTLDADAVRAKVASNPGAHMLAFYSGVQWCPYCKGMENSLLGSDEFREFLTENRVQVALFDQALSAANGGGAQLLTFKPGTEHITNTNTVSGAGYLSRHGLRGDEARVQSVLAETVANSTGAWLTPETSSARLSTPTMLLIGADGQVLGRLAAWRDRNGVFGTDNKYYDPAENVARLKDLLLLAGRADESSDYASLTRRTHEIGGSDEAVFQVNDRTECFVVRPQEKGRLTLAVGGAAASAAHGAAALASPVTIEWLRDGEVAATGTGTLSVEIAKADLAADRCVVRLTAYPDYLTRLSGGESSVFAATLESSFEPGGAGDAYAGFAAAFELGEYSGAKSVRKTSGTLPAGMKLVLDKATGAVTLAGTPKKAGTYSFAYSVRSGGALAVATGQAEIEVADPAESNPWLGAKRTGTIPLLDSDGAMRGAATFTLAKTGKLSVKVQSASGNKSFSGALQSFDGATGSATATISNAKGSLSFALAADGTVAVETDGLSGDAILAASGDFAPYVGYYTIVAEPGKAPGCVVLPVADSGSGFITLTVTAAGRATAKCVLPDGSAFSATVQAVLGEGRGALLVPVFRKTAKFAFAANIAVLPDGAKLWRDPEEVRLVEIPGGAWCGDESFDLFGGWYQKGTAESEFREIFSLPATPTVTVGAMILNDAKLRIAPATGIFQGSAKIALSGGVTVTGKIRGVLTPGWTDCGCGDDLTLRPFGAGTFIYRKNGATVSLPVTLD